MRSVCAPHDSKANIIREVVALVASVLRLRLQLVSSTSRALADAAVAMWDFFLGKPNLGNPGSVTHWKAGKQCGGSRSATNVCETKTDSCLTPCVYLRLGTHGHLDYFLAAPALELRTMQCLPCIDFPSPRVVGCGGRSPPRGRCGPRRHGCGRPRDACKQL